MIAHRSLLFAPASNARALEKIATLPCDAVLLDLEDSVAEARKEDARAAAIAAIAGLSASAGPSALAIRVNAIDSDRFAPDIAAAAGAACAVVIPKLESAAGLIQARAALAAAGGGNPLWAMIETPMGVLNLREIGAAARGARCDALIAGPNDLAAALRLPPADNAADRTARRAGLRPHLAQIALAAHAFGLAAYDGVYNDFADPDGFLAEARDGRALGFDGKTLIHPSQIAAANAVFAPSEAELDWARRVIAAFAAPGAVGAGAIRMDGAMLEAMHLRRAETMLARAAARTT